MDYKNTIISQLDIVRKDEISNSQPFKAKAYQTVISQIKNIKHPILSFGDLKEVTGIGEKIRLKIEEIFQTGKLQKAETITNSSNSSSDSSSFQIFENIYGVGPVKAKELVSEYKMKSIDELRLAVKKDSKLLNEKQKIGLKYYEDLLERIPRKEMDSHNKYITDKIKHVTTSKLISCIVGSYRRKAESSGDIDVLITSTSSKTTYIEMVTMFNNVINAFIKDKYMIELLATGPKKCLGICKINGIPRRIDLLLTLRHEYIYSILYFTGSASFNVKMRSRALELGYTMNEYGLKRVEPELNVVKKDNKNNIKNNTNSKQEEIPLMCCEKDVFDFLKMEYLDPENRI
jgi:DNA polymerase beta